MPSFLWGSWWLTGTFDFTCISWLIGVGLMMMLCRNAETREMIIREFYGHVRRLINHPEASWILDDIYRGIATSRQRAIMLREWYGPEFVIFKSADEATVSSDLSSIIAASPEKRKPIMSYLQALINQLIQKKLTGFTMLHDAMLQYFQNVKPSSQEAVEFIEILQGDDELDLLKNLAFTPSGSRVVCLALAYGTAKDRRHIVRAYRDMAQMLAYDANGYNVILAMYDVVDDTVLVFKSIIIDLVGKGGQKSTEEQIQQQHDAIIAIATHLTARTSLLYPSAGPASWLFPPQSSYMSLRPTIEEIRTTTSKKPADVRRAELCKSIVGPCLLTIATRASELIQSKLGCPFIAEILLAASEMINYSNNNNDGDNDGDNDGEDKDGLKPKLESAMAAVAETCTGSPAHDEDHIARSPAGCRMLKTLIAGGRYDAAKGRVVRWWAGAGEDGNDGDGGNGGKKGVVAAGAFAMRFWEVVRREKAWLGEWASGSGSFVVVALVEAEGFGGRAEVVEALRGERRRLEKVADLEGRKKGMEGKGGKKSGKGDGKGDGKGNVGAALLLKMLG